MDKWRRNTAALEYGDLHKILITNEANELRGEVASVAES